MDELLQRLRDGDDAAWIELRGMGPRLAEKLPEFREWLEDGDDTLRLRVIEVLETLRGEAAPALPELAHALRQGSPAVRAAAADTLAAVGAPALDLLRDALDAESADVRLAGCRALGSIGAVAAGSVPALLERACDTEEQERVRLRAVWALGEIGTEQGVERLAKVFTEEGGTIALWIAEAFGRMGRSARMAGPALRDELHRDDPELGIAAATALLELRMSEEQSVWALIRWLQEGDPEIAAEAALVLGEFGRHATSAIPALLHAEKSEHEELRRNAKLAIAKIRPEYAQA
ncbi:MAG: HEAT repeat domain-containing protein [Planctomycetota bacterium]